MSKKNLSTYYAKLSKKMQRPPKYMQMAFLESPSNKCLTHNVGVEKQSRALQGAVDKSADSHDVGTQTRGQSR